MELGALVSEPFGARGQLGEVFSGLWHSLAEQADFNGAGSRTADGHVKEDLKLGINKILNENRTNLVSDQRALLAVVGAGHGEQRDEYRQQFHFSLFVVF